ncbi:unnamed protein product [Prorocentrum cordatum]|uniref:Uncharacterized protein n=1 Tax=Prorocentrum cordatum TaxID=2364126 RepID=A0ABN9V9N4_9DINO|nr:unnamed protein product [Polarella glacialis]
MGSSSDGSLAGHRGGGLRHGTGLQLRVRRGYSSSVNVTKLPARCADDVSAHIIQRRRRSAQGHSRRHSGRSARRRRRHAASSQVAGGTKIRRPSATLRAFRARRELREYSTSKKT